MSEQIRGLEVTAALVVGGATLAGSFTKVESFKWSPDAENIKQDFLGEDGFEADQRIDGYAFSFEMQEKDNKATDLWLQIAAKFKAHLAPPNVNVVVITRFRNAALTPKTVVFENAVIKLDDSNFGSRKDYVKKTWSGICRNISGI